MNCLRADDEAPAYVAGSLTSDQLDSFEIHLLGCAECRARVRLGAGVRAALRTIPTRPSLERALIAGRAPGPRRLRRGLVVGAVTLVAASVALMLYPRSLPWTLRPSYDPLHVVTAPLFDPQPVRGGRPASATAALIDRGMEAYLRGDYARAAARLTEAAVEDSTPGVSFFLGASRLLTGDPARALPALEIAWSEIGGPFEVDARRLGAKAWLRLGRADSALAVLEPPRRGSSAAFVPLRALADSIRGAR